MKRLYALAALIIVALLGAAVHNGALDILGNLTVAGTRTALSRGTSDPSSCTAGDVFTRTDLAAASQFRVCTTTGTPGTWTAQGGGGGGTASLLNSQTGATAITGDTTDKTVFTYTLANLAAGSCIGVDWEQIHTTGSGNVTVKLFLGATAFTVYAGTNDLSYWRTGVTICNDSSVQNAQHVSHRALELNLSRVEWNGGVGTPFTSTEDTSSSKVVKLTMNAAATETVTGYAWRVLQY